MPTGGTVVAGSAAISQAGAEMRIDQSSKKAIIDWNRFNIGRDASVRFNQPNASAITLNRVGADGGRSLIDGQLSANGQVWLLNPGGALFGPNARVEVGGLLSSSMKLGNDDFLAGNYRFSKDGAGSIVNQGQLTAADGGYIALLAPEVRNEGVITARLGTVALASGDELRLDFNGDRLIELSIDQATVDSLVENKHLIQADGGLVLMSTDALNRLAVGAVNNTGIVRAQTIAEHDGVIKLLGGTATLAGTLDASAPNGGNGGFVETSGHTVNIADSAKVSTLAAQGKTGNWLIDPNDYTIAVSGGNITGAALSSNLNSSNVTIQTSTMGTPGGNGDIFVNDGVSWSSGTTLWLLAQRNITMNNPVSATDVSSRLRATAPRLIVNANVSIGNVEYQANDMTLVGITTASTTDLWGDTGIEVTSYDPRPLRIETTLTAGVLSLTPETLAKLRAPNSGVELYSNTHDITVLAALDSSHIVNTSQFGLKGTQITVGAPITTSAFLTFRTLTGDVFLNAPISAPKIGAQLDSSGSRMTQSADARVTAGLLGVIGNGDLLLDKATGGNAVDSVVGRLGGMFWLNNDHTPLAVTNSADGAGVMINGITAGAIGLSTGGTLTLNSPLTATSTGMRNTGTITDTLCTSNCVRPHIELYARGGFTNNVGANVLTLQPGTYWMLTTDNPSVTTLNGLVPGATSFDGARTESGDMMISMNRLFHYQAAATPTPTPTPTSAPTPTPTPVPTPSPTPTPGAPTHTTVESAVVSQTTVTTTATPTATTTAPHLPRSPPLAASATAQR